jgi:hypothetical protein
MQHCSALLTNMGVRGKEPCWNCGPPAEMKSTRMEPFFVRYGTTSGEIGFTLLTIRLSRLDKGL